MNATETREETSASPTMRVAAFRSGHLVFMEGTCPDHRIPAGALLVAVGPAHIVGPTVRGLARLAYDNETWLVPGCPEAEDDDAAFKAFTTWFDRVQVALGRHAFANQPPKTRRRHGARS